MITERLREWHDGLAPRERVMVRYGAVAAALLLLLAVLLPLHTRTSAARERLERKQADLAWMQVAAPAIAAAGPAPSVPASQESLVVVVDRSARESGLGQALGGSQPSGDGGLRVQLQGADFNLVVAWLARLAQQNGIGVESASIEAAGEPGRVNVGVVLRAR